MAATEPIRLLVVGGDDETAPVLKSLLRGRIERPFTVEAVREVPDTGQPGAYDVLILAVDADEAGIERSVVGRVRRAAALAAAPPLVLLDGTRNRSLEPVLLTAGAADFIWKEELSAPLLESQVRHALDARQHALLERQFHEAQRMETVGRLAGGVAHDFNNILTAIVGFGTLVAEQVRGDASAEENVAEILQAADRAAVLTRQLLAFGRRQVLHPVRLQLEDAVEGVTSLIARLIGEDIDLTVTCAPALPAIRADRAQLESALLNLAINARDAMPRGGRLTIEMHEVAVDEAFCATHVDIAPGGYVRLAVSDTGDGIPAHAQSRIFEPFFTTRDIARSNGLGLAAVYGIVKQSGGHILVYSEEKVGTTFKIYLPVDGAAAADADRVAPAREPATGTGTILLVEDADGIRRLAAEVIRRAGYHVIEAADPMAAIDAAVAHRGEIDLLLTDIVMPGGNGVELARRLTAGRRLNVLFMSGYTDDAAIRNGMLAGEAAFIQKPFTPQELLRKVKQVIEVGA